MPKEHGKEFFSICFVMKGRFLLIEQCVLVWQTGHMARCSAADRVKEENIAFFFFFFFLLLIIRVLVIVR